MIIVFLKRMNGSTEGEAVCDKGVWRYFKHVTRKGKLKRVPAKLPYRLQKQLNV